MQWRMKLIIIMSRKGLFLSLFTLTGAVSLFLWLSAVQLGIFQSVFLSRLDERLFAFFSEIRSDFWMKILDVITFAGKWEIIVPVSFLIAFLWFRKKQYPEAFVLLFTMCANSAFIHFAKNFVERPRPPFLYNYELTFSYPSGHAATAMAFYGILAYILTKRAPRAWVKIILPICAVAIIALVGYTRIYLGVHFASDVLGGFLVGLIWLSAGCTLYALNGQVTNK